ncbi:unnamed protein product [Prorocentrum cordatum]|uniref:Uncharacterized protein n=1 Tax=Prorocentrum cordatum TaxID=2364126 RepID=A0ABN9W0E1_9DINO|nr:unnamed protein product [Polarella glacialis]
MPQLLGPEAAEPVARVVLRTAAEDNASSVRQAAVIALPQLVRTDAVQPVVLRAATEDENPSVRQAAAKLLLPDVAKLAVRKLVGQLGKAKCSNSNSTGRGWDTLKAKLWTKFKGLARADRIKKKVFNGLGHLVEYFVSLGHAALQREVPMLVSVLASALPCVDGSDEAVSFVIKLGSALARLASTAGLYAMDILIVVHILTQVESTVGLEDTSRNTLQFTREVLQRVIEGKCASFLSKQAGTVIHVEHLDVEIPLGTMMFSDGDRTDAHRCPNRFACSVSQSQKMQPARTNISAKVKEGSCPLLLSTPPGRPRGAIDKVSSVCAAGFDSASPGCAKCLAGFGRNNKDPFACEPCGKPGRAAKWAVWFAQPLVIFLLSLRSADVAASNGVADTLANDVVKIGLAYLASTGVVLSAVTSTDAYRELNATDSARKMFNLTQLTVQRGDVTYSFSNDCFLKDGRGAASVDELLVFSLERPAYVVTIAAILVGILDVCRYAFSGDIFCLRKLRAKFVSRMITFSLVAGNQFLPSVVSAGMRALPCFHTQAASDGMAPLQFMSYENHVRCHDTYLEYIINSPYVGTCGAVLVFSYTAGPAYWLTLLHRQQRVRQAGPVKFLTGSYRDGYHWWEVGRLISKTMLIASIVTASPTSYCPLQQLMLCLIVTFAYCTWHCFNCPYTDFALNAVEAGALLTLGVTMGLSGLLAGAKWPLTPGFRNCIVNGIFIALILYFSVLVGVWVKVKFFWHHDANEQVLAEDGSANDQ